VQEEYMAEEPLDEEPLQEDDEPQTLSDEDINNLIDE